ncbi:Translation initiation factor 2 [hydrothermal vent metagenome]|uniref:Translation initiation factor 2 n=1 Tax=hydrothermal vent metagenome TaxID=652676 RepID=A0A3B1DCI6_9ZZZZ
MRVFELSKEIGISSKELIEVLKQMDIEVKSHMSTLTEDDVQAVMKRKDLPKAKTPAKKGKSKKKVEAPPPEPPKKRFVLRKKRVAPPVEVEAVVSPESEISSEDKPLESTVVPTAVDEKAVVPAALESEAIPPAEKVESLPVAEEVKLESASVPPPDEMTPPVVVSGQAVGDKAKKEVSLPSPKPEAVVAGEKKKAKPEPSTEKPKEKPKRPKRVKWNASGGNANTGGQGDQRKWQDFKPIHRREDRKSSRKGHGPAIDAAKPRRKVIKIYEGLTVKEFSELIGQKVTSIVAKLMELGKMATINQAIDLDEATLIAEAFEVKTEVVAEKTEEELLMGAVPDDPADLVGRPPVITIMGHVDHGKTSLLDAIRETKVTSGEAGGITQHIGAYMVSAAGKPVTFLDTPGHAAFTAMRARGAQVTDIVVLVVAADDGVMPQTVEAVNHAKSAEVPIIVVVNKMDRPDANPDRVKQALSEYELIPEEWGGSTIFVEVSAKEKTGLDSLLEMILLQSEVLELQANPKKSMRGVIVEAKIERGRGPVATVLVQEGTLSVGSAFVSGIHYGKVRALINDEGKKVKSAEPSTPVEVIGLDGVPQAGDTFIVVADERVARDVASSRAQRERTSKLSKVNRMTLDDLFSELKDGAAEVLKVIIKTDVQGSAEAIREALEGLSTDAVKLEVVHVGVGGITESDVMLAAASRAFVAGFNVRPESKARDLADREKVELRLYSIIYKLIDDVRAAMEGLLAPTLKERILGRIEVRQIFSVPKQGTIAGGYVKEGVAARNCAGVRVFRGGNVIFDGKLASLRRFKDDVKEVQAGYECGVGVEGFNDIEVDDIFELFVFDEIATKLETK